MKKKGFEIVMCIYKGDQLVMVEKCLNSLENQILKPDLISIFVNGFVKNDLYNFIKLKSKSKNYRILYSTKNMGLAYGLNRLIESSLYKYLVRMDADDLSTKNRLLLINNTFEKNNDISVLGSLCFENNEKGALLREYSINNKDIINDLKYKSPMCHASCTFNSELLGEDLYYNENYINTQDLELWVRLLSKNYIFKNINLPLYIFNTSNQIGSRRNFSKLKLEIPLYIRANKLFGLSYKAIIFVILRILYRMLGSIAYSYELRNLIKRL